MNTRIRIIGLDDLWALYDETATPTVYDDLLQEDDEMRYSTRYIRFVCHNAREEDFKRKIKSLSDGLKAAQCEVDS